MSQSDRDLELRLLLEAVYAKYHYDFRGYAMASLKRRLSRALDVLACRTLSALQEKVIHDPTTFPRLLPFLTVQVSDMFRDPSYYRLLRERVLPVLKTYPSLKLWVAGCSTGEEVHSLAILLHEEQVLERSLIYATDISADSLLRAQSGIYELDRLAAWSQSYRDAGGRASLSDYYTAAYGAAVFDKALRKNVVFSDHSLATDSVFAEVQFVSCRNVLIYFNRALQDRAVGLFADALCRRGFLGLGSKESLLFTESASLFEQIAPDARIYQRI
jgi:chemotaxis protein methyltransferase CheR